MARVYVLVAVVMLTSACSFSFGSSADDPESVRDLAEDLVVDISDDGDLEVSSTTCQLPPDVEDGTAFRCSSDSPSGTIQWLAEISEDGVSVNSTNLITVEGLELLLPAVAEVVADDTSVDYTAADLSCPMPPIVLDAAGEMRCDLELSGGGTQTLAIEITDTQNGDFRVRPAE